MCDVSNVLFSYSFVLSSYDILGDMELINSMKNTLLYFNIFAIHLNT